MTHVSLPNSTYLLVPIEQTTSVPSTKSHSSNPTQSSNRYSFNPRDSPLTAAPKSQSLNRIKPTSANLPHKPHPYPNPKKFTPSLSIISGFPYPVNSNHASGAQKPNATPAPPTPHPHPAPGKAHCMTPETSGMLVGPRTGYVRRNFALISVVR